MPTRSKDSMSFKRLIAGTKFICQVHGQPNGLFRKVDSKNAYRINENGSGQTHQKLMFSRSAAVTVI